MAEKKKNKRVGSIIFRIVLIIIAGLTVGLGVFSWNASHVVGNQLPMPFGVGISVVLSPSMEPALKTNDLVVVKKQDSYEKGDIVVYQEGRMLVIHRIVDIDEETVITKGDANNSADEPIAIEDIKAKLAFRVPFVGLIVKFAKSVPGTLLILAGALYLLYRSRQKERKKAEDELDDIVLEIKRLKESLAEQGESQKDEDNSPEEQVSAEKQDNAADAPEKKEEKIDTDDQATDSGAENPLPQDTDDPEEKDQDNSEKE